MSEGSLRRSISVVVVLLALFALTCATVPPPPAPPPPPPAPIDGSLAPPNNCSRNIPTLNAAAPVVCVGIEAGRIIVNPPVVTAWDRNPSNPTNPVTIIWVTRGGGRDLRITMKGTSCVETPVCNGAGECSVNTKDVPSAGAQCQYGVFLDGVEVDPDVVIVDCC